MVTIRDVAERAGVSRSTVSLVLNKSPLVKEETRALVLAVIKEMNYVPNNNARGLSNKTMNSLGVIIMNESQPSNSYNFDNHSGLCAYNISNGIMSGLADTDYGIITEAFCSVAEPDRLPKIIGNRRVDGAFIVGSPYAPELVANMKKTGIPFVLVGVNSYEQDADSVLADPGEGSALAIRYLVETGHKRICFLNCPTRFRSYYVRKHGVEQLVKELGVEYNPEWFLSCEHNQGASAYKTMTAFLDTGARPDAIVAANAPLALGAMRRLHELGIRVPEDVSIIPYEDSVLCGYAVPALTAINIQKEKLGQLAAKLLLERMKDPDRPYQKIVVPPYMTFRDSVLVR